MIGSKAHVDYVWFFAELFTRSSVRI